MSYSRQLVVLVGGKGTRLGELAKLTPKPLMPVADGDVFLDYVLESAVRQGFSDILLIAGHLGEQVQARYDHVCFKGANVSVLVEPEPRGTAGALQLAREHLAATFVLINGDTFFDINIRALDTHLQRSPAVDGVLALRQVDDVGRYGCVEQREDGTISAFREKNPAFEGVRGVINGGIYALRREVASRVSHFPASIETELFPILVGERRLAGLAFDGYFLDIGLPETLAKARADLPGRRRPVLFLDRDGVLNVDRGHVSRWEEWQWIPGAVDLIKAANDANIAVVVVTNQAGVAKGYYEEPAVWALHMAVQKALFACGAFVDAFFYSPDHPEAVHPEYRIDTPFSRKPMPGMLLRAARQHKLNLHRSLLVGDQQSDVQAALAAGVPALRFEGEALYDLVTRSPEWAAMIR